MRPSDKITLAIKFGKLRCLIDIAQDFKEPKDCTTCKQTDTGVVSDKAHPHFFMYSQTLLCNSNAHIVTKLSYLQKFVPLTKLISCDDSTAVPGFRVLGFCALPGFRALKAGDGAWSVHKTLIGFRALLSQLLIKKMSLLNKTQVKFT